MVTQAANVMKVNSIAFLGTISKNIKFDMAGKLHNMYDTTIVDQFKFIMKTYGSQGFKVNIILGNNQFEYMHADLADAGSIINVVSADEHVPNIE